jgi:hypothetical protein
MSSMEIECPNCGGDNLQPLMLSRPVVATPSYDFCWVLRSMLPAHPLTGTTVDVPLSLPIADLTPRTVT